MHNYYEVNGIKPEQLRAEFEKWIKLTNTGYWTMASSSRLNTRSIYAFLKDPRCIQYRTAQKIHNWIKDNQAKFGGQNVLS